MNARHSWWIGRAWMIAGWWLVTWGVVRCLAPGVSLVYSSRTLTALGSRPFMVAVIQGSLLVAGGLASMWAGRQRLAQVIDPSDAESIKRVIARVKRVLHWGLGVVGALAAVLILAWPWIRSTLAVQFVSKASTVLGIHQIHHVRGGGASFTEYLRGRLEMSHVEHFITINGLLPDPRADNLRDMASRSQLQEWDKEWPNNPLWYSRRWRRPNDTCRMGCYVLCLVDRRSGGVWIAVEEPDFAGD